MYPLGTWFVSGICVWIPCIKETLMMMMMMMMTIIIIIIIIIFLSQEVSSWYFCVELTVILTQPSSFRLQYFPY